VLLAKWAITVVLFSFIWSETRSFFDRSNLSAVEKARNPVSNFHRSDFDKAAESLR
jgi:hypothetical protein